MNKMKKTNQERQIDTQKMLASILHREGLDKFTIVEYLIQDYYSNVPVDNIHSIWSKMFDRILVDTKGNKRFSPNMEKSLIDFYHQNCRNIYEIKQIVYRFMDKQELWSIDSCADFHEYVYHQMDELLESDEYYFDWKIDSIVWDEENN